jgi:5-hydroxyisourate hydrolase
MSRITTHVLDTSRGCPAKGVPVTLEANDRRSWKLIGSSKTDADGRITAFTFDDAEFQTGVYRLIFETHEYFASQNLSSFYPQIIVQFKIEDPSQHYHVPLLLSPFGYSTYRGS